MASKMATLATAEALLEELRAKSLAAARADLADVQAHAKAQGFTEELKCAARRPQQHSARHRTLCCPLAATAPCRPSSASRP